MAGTGDFWNNFKSNQNEFGFEAELARIHKYICDDVLEKYVRSFGHTKTSL